MHAAVTDSVKQPYPAAGTGIIIVSIVITGRQVDAGALRRLPVRGAQRSVDPRVRGVRLDCFLDDVEGIDVEEMDLTELDNLVPAYHHHHACSGHSFLTIIVVFWV